MCEWFRSSIGKKAVMAVTGLILSVFVVAHMLGNLQIFMGQEALNDYARHLKEFPFLLWPARVFLLVTLALHLWIAAVLTLENRKARPEPYAIQESVEATYASRTMMLSGMLILFFIVYHLLHFTFGMTNPELAHLVDGKGRHDVYSMVVRSYQNVYVSLAYILAMVPLGLHLSHGLASFPHSLGVETPDFQPALKIIANAFALLIFLGNSLIPIAVLLGAIPLPE